jgi:hypothetical protein
MHPDDAAPAARNGVAFIPAAHLERVLELAAGASGGGRPGRQGRRRAHRGGIKVDP